MIRLLDDRHGLLTAKGSPPTVTDATGFIMPTTLPLGMADLNRIAKRIHNISPKPLRLTLDDGSTAVYHLSSTEWFQTEFQGQGTREGDDADYRFTTTADESAVIVGRKGPNDDGWAMIGEVVEVERVEA
ncbi:hypothetical protein HSB1_27330 [Halogranum salarium B-1]|uniref:DUF8072 domain-containing protein n=2 Tax=Halogranum rubrum TaxID=553466 RepID=J3EWM8_9EURY|nr:hypothetical protein HSB1_27330 [Halogranum salarium B-1]